MTAKEPEDSDNTYTRITTYTLDDSTILQMSVSLKPIEIPLKPGTKGGGYEITRSFKLIFSPKGQGPPGRDDYPPETIEQHRTEERVIVNEHGEWAAVYNENPPVDIIANIRLERIWDTDLRKADGYPLHSIQVSTNASLKVPKGQSNEFGLKMGYL